MAAAAATPPPLCLSDFLYLQSQRSLLKNTQRRKCCGILGSFWDFSDISRYVRRLKTHFLISIMNYSTRGAGSDVREFT